MSSSPPPRTEPQNWAGVELVMTQIQLPMKGRELIWEVVAVDIGTGHRTILESWTDCRRAITERRGSSP
jgi:hypothetical protein